MTRSRTMSVAGIIVLAAFSSGCDGPGPEADPTHQVPAKSLSSPASYCEIQGLRALIADGLVSVDALPDSVDLTEVEGTPRIVDFTTSPDDGRSRDEVLDELFASPGLRDVHVGDSYTYPCLQTTTEADVVRTQGAPGELADDDAETPEPDAGPAEQVPSLGETLGAYCLVQAARTMINDGDLTLDDLPDGVDTTSVNGTPRLVDFTTTPVGTDHWTLTDTLIDDIRDYRITMKDPVRDCMESTTDADVENSQGGPGFRSS